MTPLHTQPHLLFTIDPSIANLGYALLASNAGIRTCGLLKQTSDPMMNYHTRGLDMARHVGGLLSNLIDEPQSRVDMIIEVPANWFNQRGQASKDNEAIQKLYYTTGAIVALMSMHPLVEAIWCTTPVWKGSVPKKIMVQRAHKYAQSQGRELSPDVPHDTAEALLLARWALNRYEPLNQEFGLPMVRLFRTGYLNSSQFAQEEFIDYVEHPD